MNVEQIAYNIKFLREQNEWTQKDLSEKLLLSRSVIAKWENGAVIPDVSSIIKLSNLFNVSLDHIIGNHTYREDLLKEFKRIYSSKSIPFDEEVVELVEHLMMYPTLKEQIYRLKNLPIKKQKSLHMLFSRMIDEYEQF